jgi:hypothetical protein
MYKKIDCRRSLLLIVISMSLGNAAVCLAAPEEIQVYMDDLSKPGQFGVDVHNNYVVSGDSAAPYLGGQAANHVYRLTPEFYYGVTDSVELGMYLLSSREPGADPRLDGAKMRIKFVAPHDPEAGFYWGANLEIGRTVLRVSDVPWNAEFKGIFGYRDGLWTYAITPNIELPVSTRGGPATSEIHSKIGYSTSKSTMLGLESYNELGPLSHAASPHEVSQVLYAALDQEFKRFDLNVGIGHGLTHASDSWVIKFIIGTHF